MPTVDFGSVTLSVDDGRVDAYFPFEQGGLKDALKRLKGRWNPDRRCWTVIPRFAGADEEAIVASVEAALWETAPGPWRGIVERFSGFACATRRYEVKFGPGGLRLMLPPGHPCHWNLEKTEGASRQGETWSIPAAFCKAKAVMPILQRAAREDARAFIGATEPYEGRTMKGTVPVSPAEADSLRLVPGKVVFAEFGFVKAADPLVVNMPVHAWPFRVISREDTPGEGYESLEEGVSIKLEHLPPEHGCKAVRKLQALPEDRRPPKLDRPHAIGKWHCRRG